MLEPRSNHGFAPSGDKSAWPHWVERFYLIGASVTGIAIDWHCAFEWFGGKYSFWSGTVLQRMALIVLLCAAIGCFAMFAQRNKWQLGITLFFAASANLSFNLLLSWI